MLRNNIIPLILEKNSLKYICSVLKEVKNQEKDNRSYGYDDPPEQVTEINDRVRNIQISPIVGWPAPVINQTSHIDQQNVQFDDESL